jgi:hypothetical protein
MNYRLLSGPFKGNVVAESGLLNVAFEDLDDDMQLRIREWAEKQLEDEDGKYLEIDGGDFGYKHGGVARLNDIKSDYENSWDTIETEEQVDLLPASTW